jgi:hypothetical protein
MSAPDQWLSQVYGTGGGEDLEKTAQMHILSKLAEEEGVDLSGLDDEQLEQLYYETQGGDEGGYVEDDGQGGEEYLAKEAAAKFEEADFLGRVMAHSFTQEMDKLAEAEAGSRPRGGIGRRVDQARHHVGRATEATENFGRKGTDAIGRGAARAGKAVGRGASRAARGVASSQFGRGVARGAKAVGGHAMRNRGKYGLGAVAAGGAYGAHKMRKEASAFEKLALDHAANILGANGIDPSTGGPMTPQAPVQLGGDQFGQALDDRAFQILEENGYDVSQLVGDEGGDEGGYDGGMQA